MQIVYKSVESEVQIVFLAEANDLGTLRGQSTSLVLEKIMSLQLNNTRRPLVLTFIQIMWKYWNVA